MEKNVKIRRNKRKNERKKAEQEKREKKNKYVKKENNGATKSVRIFKVCITTYIVVKGAF